MKYTPIQYLNLMIPQIAIAGVGLLGGSLGLALKQAGYQGKRLGIGRRSGSLDKAIQHGCIDEAIVSYPLVWSFDRPTLLVLTLPICSFEEIFKQIAAVRANQDQCSHDLFITDAGSTKQVVCDWASQYLPDSGYFVGAHPMAGSEKQGPEYASERLFQGRPCILTPQEKTREQAVKVVESLWQTMGMALLRMNPQQHDQVVASISHLPHALAMLMVRLASEQQGALDIASGGFRDTTRIASGDPTIWRDIFMTNRQSLTAIIDQLIEELQHLRQNLEHGEEAVVFEKLFQAKTIRDHWVQKGCD